MAVFKFGHVVLAEFPFADMRQTKRRPALVLSQDSENDIVLLRITSTPREGNSDVPIREWQEAGLRLPSVVRVEKVVTSNLVFVHQLLGTLSSSDSPRVLAALRKSCEQFVAP